MWRAAESTSRHEVFLTLFGLFSGLGSSLLKVVLIFILCVAQTVAFPPAFGAQENSAIDFDADGLPNEDDPCPYIPKPDSGGKGAEFCGPASRKVMHDYLFLWSRTTRLPSGIEKQLLKKTGPFHALIHFQKTDSPVVLTPAQRKRLAGAGVRLLEYLPHYSWYAKFDAPRSARTAAEMEFVKGISSMQVRDRIDPSLLQDRGPVHGRNGDGTLTVAVTFFDDTGEEARQGTIRAAGGEVVVGDGNEVHIRVQELEGLMALARQDAIQTITDIPGLPTDKTDNARVLANADPVSTTLGLIGSGVTVAMAEPGIVPLGHPDLTGRVQRFVFQPALSTGTLTIVDVLDPVWRALVANVPFIKQKSLRHAQFVGSILAGSGATLPGRRGLLPAADLLSYSVITPLAKTRYFTTGEHARLARNAAVINHSWGPEKLNNKAGRYTKRGRWLDRVVANVGLPVVWAAGNTKCGNRDVPGCAPVPSLPHPVAKNDISVGNVIADTGILAADSAAGPAADGRLKPDVVAPGDGLETVRYDFLLGGTNTVFPHDFGGTSASAPVVSGIVGMMTEVFQIAGLTPGQIRPELLKAILIETAIDVGAPGPDFLSGYGLVNATEAVRLAQDTTRQITGSVSSANTTMTFPIQVNEPRQTLSATLVWTDLPGAIASTLTLVNDLDLTLTSPSGMTIFRSFNLGVPPATTAAAGMGSLPCADVSCMDRVNNVEKVLVGGGGTIVEQGTWTVTVTANRLVTNTQPFAVAVSRPCPIVVGRGVVQTLSGDIECNFDPATPEAVVLKVPSARLDCNDFTIRGNGWAMGASGQYVGVLADAIRTQVLNCGIENFNVGIKLTKNSGRGSASLNELQDLGSAGIHVDGLNNRIMSNTIRTLNVNNAIGINVLGGATNVTDNFIGARSSTAGANQQETAIYWKAPGSVTLAQPLGNGPRFGSIARNEIGGATFGIEVEGDLRDNVGAPVTLSRLRVIENDFEGIRRDAIVVTGRTAQITVATNDIQGLGRDGRGIVVLGSADSEIDDNEINCGTLRQGTKTGIEIRASSGGFLDNNTITWCGIGIHETGNIDLPIRRNGISNNPRPLQPIGIGILSDNSTTSDLSNHIVNNNMVDLNVGIILDGKGTASAKENTISVEGVGIQISASADSDRIEAVGNTISAKQTGVIAKGAHIAIAGNTISEFAQTGIYLDNASDSVVELNNLTLDQATGVRIVGGTTNSISQNQIAGVQTTDTRGLVFGDLGCSATNRPTVRGNVFESLEIAVNVLCPTSDLAFSGNTITQSEDAIIQQQGALLSVDTFEDNRFEDNTRHVTFVAPVIGRQNTWGDVGSLRIFDSNGDGLGDCGADFPYTSQVFGGSTTAENRTALSVQVQDTEPVTSVQGNCPP